MTTTRTFVAAIAAGTLLVLSSAEAASVSDAEGSPVDTSALVAAADIARAGGVRELVAHVLDDNREMLEVIRRARLPCRKTSEDGVCRVVVSLVGD